MFYGERSMVTTQDLLYLKKELKKKGLLCFNVVSGSMEPIIKTGEKIIVQNFESEPSEFDIVVFFQRGILICHYIWHVNQMRSKEGHLIYVTRGLHGREDLPIEADQVLGRVTSHRISSWNRLRITLKDRLFS